MLNFIYSAGSVYLVMGRTWYESHIVGATCRRHQSESTSGSRTNGSSGMGYAGGVEDRAWLDYCNRVLISHIANDMVPSLVYGRFFCVYTQAVGMAPPYPKSW